jgi:hypothetical protein
LTPAFDREGHDFSRAVKTDLEDRLQPMREFCPSRML